MLRLMLGDWVLDKKNMLPVKIENGTQIEKCEELGYKPMPLTGDILNEWFPDTRDGVYWCWDDTRSCETGENWYEIRFDINSYDTVVMGFRYVHELQHMLTFYEKDINFEVWKNNKPRWI